MSFCFGVCVCILFCVFVYFYLFLFIFVDLTMLLLAMLLLLALSFHCRQVDKRDLKGNAQAENDEKSVKICDCCNRLANAVGAH